MSCENRPASNGALDGTNAITKTCGECGAKFLCGPQEDNGDCWCDRLPNIMPLTAAADGCLCKACLQVAIERRMAARPDTLN